MHADEFERLLHQGRGRAIQHLQQHDAAPYRDLLRHACLRNVSFDAQMEGPRGQYLYELIYLTAEPAFYREQVLTTLACAETIERDWDRIALLDLARCFAQHGDATARAALYERFARNTATGNEEGAEQLIELDGLAGFLHVANVLGARSLAEPGEWADDRYLSLIEEQIGKEAIATPLAGARRTSPHVEAFLSEAEALRAQRTEFARQRRPLVGLPYAEVRERIVAGRDRPPVNLKRWGESAPLAELLLAAQELLIEDEPRRLTDLLHIFRGRAFPLNPQRLLDLVTGEDALHAWLAAQALAHLDDPAIRSFALGLLERPDRVAEAITILASTFRESDLSLFESILQWNLDAETIHSLGHRLEKALKNHPSPANVPLLLALYDKTPCSNGRESYVKLLLALNSLPDALREECRFDCNLDLRALVGC